jgi:hypothetical protein
MKSIRDYPMSKATDNFLERKHAARGLAKRAEMERKEKEREEKKSERERMKAALEAHKRSIAHDRRRGNGVSVRARENGFTKLQRYSTTGMIMRTLREKYPAGAIVGIKQLERDCDEYLYGMSINMYLIRLERDGHIEIIRSPINQQKG